MDEALRIARGTLPGVFVSNINVPSRPAEVYHVLAKFPEDKTPAGRSRVHIDQFSGAVLGLENTRTVPPGTRMLNLKRASHTGDLFGAPMRALYFLGSAALAGQIVSGVLIWWRPKRKPARVDTQDRSSSAP